MRRHPFSYADDPTWPKVQAFLPPGNRIDDIVPFEEWMQLGRCQVHVDRYRQEHPRATVVMLHGVGGNGRLLSFISVPLARAGYEVICPDLPLYGLTRFAGPVEYGSWVDAASELVRRVRRTGLPLFLCGLSAGGMLAYQVACEEKVDGIMVTCLLDQTDPAVTEATASSPVTARLGKPFLRATRRILGDVRVPMRAICNMAAIVNVEELARLLMADPLSAGTRVPLRFVRTMLDLRISVPPQSFDRCPVLLAHPSDDRWCDVSLSCRFFDRLACPHELAMLPESGHFPIEPGGLEEFERASLAFMERNCRAVP